MKYAKGSCGTETLYHHNLRTRHYLPSPPAFTNLSTHTKRQGTKTLDISNYPNLKRHTLTNQQTFVKAYHKTCMSIRWSTAPTKQLYTTHKIKTNNIICIRSNGVKYVHCIKMHTHKYLNMRRPHVSRTSKQAHTNTTLSKHYKTIV